MATDTAPIARQKRLWQVPVFFLGCMAAVGMYYFHDHIAHASPNRPEHLLAIARTAITATPIDTAAAIAAAGRVIEHSELPTATLGEAHYLLGCAYLEQGDADAKAKARHHLEQADVNGVPDGDRNQLTLNLAKTWLATNADPQQIIRALTKVAAASDSPFEVYGLLIEAQQRVNPPDQAAVIEATRQQLAHAPAGFDANKLNAARLRFAELLIAAGNDKEARIVLSRVGAEAPTDIAIAATMLSAKCYENAQDWPSAIKTWEGLRSDARLSAADKARVLYQLGLALGHAGQVAEASQTFLSVVEQGSTGPWAKAATIRLAELQVSTNAKSAIENFNSALNGIQSADAYQNPALPVEELREVLEHTCERLKTGNDFASAIEIATIYSHVAAPGRAAELRGQTFTAWAESLAQSGQTELAVAKAGEAGRAFLDAAAEPSPEAVTVYRLWTAAQFAVNGRAYPVALEALNRLVPLHPHIPPAQVAEAWFITGQVQENLQSSPAAIDAYQHCLGMEGVWRFRARYQLAQLNLADARKDLAIASDKNTEEARRIQGELAAKIKFDDAEKLLQENLNELRQAVNPAPAVQELTVYGLADIAYERSEYQTAEPRLKGALQEYPQSSLAVRAHYRLALCIWKTATEVFKELSTLSPTDPKRDRTQKQYLDLIAAAIEQYAAVEAALVQRPSLSSDETEMLKRSAFGLAELKYFAGKYAEAADTYEALSRRYDGKVEGLHALHQLWNCHKNCLNQPEKAVQTMERLQTALEKLPPTEFNGSSDIHNRDHWVQKLVEMAKQN